MIVELSAHDLAVLLKAIRDKRLDTDELEALRVCNDEAVEFRGFNFLPWTGGLENSDASRYQEGQDNAHLHGYIDDGRGGYQYVGRKEAMKHQPFKNI